MKLTILFLYLLTFSQILFSQSEDPPSQVEIYVFNESEEEIMIMVYPVGMVFNHDYEYNLLARQRRTATAPFFYYINGISSYTDAQCGNGLEFYHYLSGSGFAGFDADCADLGGRQAPTEVLDLDYTEWIYFHI